MLNMQRWNKNLVYSGQRHLDARDTTLARVSYCEPGVMFWMLNLNMRYRWQIEVIMGNFVAIAVKRLELFLECKRGSHAIENMVIA